MFNWLKEVLSKRYHSINAIEVSAQRLSENYSSLRSMNDKLQIAPVLKSNAYGHGLTVIAKVLDDLTPPFLCIDSLYEGYELLKAGVKSPILIMGYVDPENLAVKRLPFSYAVFDFETMKRMHRYQPHAGFHIFVDTGMHREGIVVDELIGLIHESQSLSGLHIEGLMSHFAQADKYEDTNTLKQLKEFERAHDILKNAGIQPKYVHICASSGLLNSKYFSEFEIGNIARVGRALYGIAPIEDANVKPVLKVTTKLAQIKKLRKGESVGYDFTFTAKKDMLIGILPIGYADGFERRLSNKGVVFVNNKPYPIIGRVSMNVTTIDISALENAKVGQEVTVYSDNPSHPNSIENSAKLIDAIPYEIAVHLNPAIRRRLI